MKEYALVVRTCQGAMMIAHDRLSRSDGGALLNYMWRTERDRWQSKIWLIERRKALILTYGVEL